MRQVTKLAVQVQIHITSLVSFKGIYSLFNVCINKVSYVYLNIFIGESSQSSEWQSDWTSSSESERKSTVKRKVLGKSRAKKLPKIVSETSDTDNSSDEQLEKCPICLLPFRRQQLGTPSSCEHCFCLECLVEWSKNINTCPVDRSSEFHSNPCQK